MSQSEIQSGHLAIAEFTERGMLCEEVDEISSRSHVDIQQPNARLEFAASLFMLGQLDDSCLNKELDFVNLKKQAPLNRYFVKALISPAFSEEQKKYLDLSCGEDKKYCDLNFMFESKIGSNLKEVLSKVEKTWQSSSWTYKIAALKLFNQFGQSEQALSVISSLQSDGIQSTGLIEHQVKALYRANSHQEVKEVLRGVKSVIIDKDYARLNSNLCLQDLDSSCLKGEASCKNFLDLVSVNKDLLSETGPARTVFKYYNCKNQLSENLEYWSLIENENIQELVQWALYLKQPTSKAIALSKLRFFVEDKAKPQNLRWDALQVLLHNTNYDKDWLLAVRFWNEFSPYNDSYLSASQWIVNEAKQQKRESEIFAIEKVLNENPGILLAHKNDVKNINSFRLPAEVPQIMEKK
jgi:hypothetical protein